MINCYHLPKESQDCLRGGVRLGKSSQGCLLQSLRLGQVGGFRGDIGVAKARFRGRESGDLRLCELNRVLQSVLARANLSLSGTQVCKGRSNSCQGGKRRRLVGYDAGTYAQAGRVHSSALQIDSDLGIWLGAAPADVNVDRRGGKRPSGIQMDVLGLAVDFE